MTKDIILLESRVSELKEMLSATVVALGLNGNYQELVNQAKEVLQRRHLTSRSSRAAGGKVNQEKVILDKFLKHSRSLKW